MVAVLPARKVQAWLLSYWHNKINGIRTRLLSCRPGKSRHGCCPTGTIKKKNNNNNNFCSFKSSDTFIALPGPSILTTTQKQRCKRASNFIHKFNIQRRQSAQSLQGWPTAPNFTHRYQKYKSYPANLLKQEQRPAPSMPTAARAKLAPRREREKNQGKNHKKGIYQEKKRGGERRRKTARTELKFQEPYPIQHPP